MQYGHTFRTAHRKRYGLNYEGNRKRSKPTPQQTNDKRGLMFYYVRAIFDIIIKANDKQDAKEKFIEHAHRTQKFHLQAESIEIEEHGQE